MQPATKKAIPFPKLSAIPSPTAGPTACARIFARAAYPSPSPIRSLGIKIVENAIFVTLNKEKKIPVPTRQNINIAILDASICAIKNIPYPALQMKRIFFLSNRSEIYPAKGQITSDTNDIRLAAVDASVNPAPISFAYSRTSGSVIIPTTPHKKLRIITKTNDFVHIVSLFTFLFPHSILLSMEIVANFNSSLFHIPLNNF